jgi:DNA-binding NtrC family response regulator
MAGDLQSEHPEARNMQRKILLVDDDPDFCILAQSFALSFDVQLDFYHSFSSLGRLGRVRDYDAAIFDHYLDGTSGYELVEYVNLFSETTPLFLISSQEDLLVKEQKKIRHPSYFQFISKGIGVEKILDRVLESLERRDFLRKYSRVSAQ